MAGHRLADQSAHLGNGPEAAPAELREVQRLLEIGFEVLEIHQVVAVEIEQVLKGIGLRRQQFKAVVVHRHGDRAGSVSGQAPGPEEADPLVHKSPFEGIHKQVAAFAAFAQLHQQLIAAGQAGEVGLPFQQRFERLQFGCVEPGFAG